jgi:ParB-like chromosome segregation protein Spo0J
VVYIKDNRYYILDGHHRVARAQKSGAKIQAYVFSENTQV